LNDQQMQTIFTIDSHTGGEPTRIIYDCDIDLGAGTLAERRSLFQAKHDAIRRAVVNEPRGSDVLVGGLLCEPVDPTCAAGIIFFNNTGYLGMCGHGLIGAMVTLKHLGQIAIGQHRIETPVGVVAAELCEHGAVTIENVPSYRTQHEVTIEVPDYGVVTGNVAWGGNWFFLVKDSPETLLVKNWRRLTDVSLKIRDALAEQGITGDDEAYIDHIELFGAPHDPQNHSRNFVLCPGGAYDRSPCGTGTSAKLACLAADGKLAPGKIWRQESIVGSVFSGHYRFATANETSGTDRNAIIASISGMAWVCAEAKLILNPADPFCMGLPS